MLAGHESGGGAKPAAAAAAAPSSGASSADAFQSAAVFHRIAANLKADPGLLKKVRPSVYISQ